MSKWYSDSSDWIVDLPNMPTLIVKLLIFYLCILMVKSAIANQNLTIGIIALVIVQLDIKLGNRVEKRTIKQERYYGHGHSINDNLKKFRPKK